MNQNRTLDAIDLQILDILQANARTPNAEIARQVGMAPSAILERIRKLERHEVIQAYETRVDPKAIGRGLTAFTFVHTQEKVGSKRTGRLLSEISGVVEVHYCAGQDAYLVKLRVADTDHLSRLIMEFGRIESVRDTRTTIVLTTVAETTRLPLKPEAPGRDHDDL